MAKKIIQISTEFYASSVRKEEFRDSTKVKENVYSAFLVDNKNKDKKDGDWNYSSISVNLRTDIDPGIEFGKKYKITIEEI